MQVLAHVLPPTTKSSASVSAVFVPLSTFPLQNLKYSWILNFPQAHKVATNAAEGLSALSKICCKCLRKKYLSLCHNQFHPCPPRVNDFHIQICYLHLLREATADRNQPDNRCSHRQCKCVLLNFDTCCNGKIRQ